MLRVVSTMAVLLLAGLAGMTGAGCAAPTNLDGEPLPEPPDDDTPPPPPDGTTCAPDEHACGRSCFTDQANDPAIGCALGCGEACPAPANGVAVCTPGGTCDIACAPGYARDGAACVPFACEAAGYACGAFVDDAGTAFDCGSCAPGTGCGPTHQCAVARDAYEPNDARGQAHDLGPMDDAEDPTKWLDRLTVASTTDEDWFTFPVLDGWDGGNPDVRVQLTDRVDGLGWLSSSHELTVWFQCDSGDAGTVVRCGEWYSTFDENGLSDPGLGVGCQVDATYLVWADIAPACAGVTDSGRVTIRVRKTSAPRGDTYDMFVGVD